MLGQQGADALAAKDYKTAEDDFRHADAVFHAPTLVLGLARALAAQGKLVAAQEAYMRILREGVAPGAPEAFKRALVDAKREVEDVSPRIGGIVVTVNGKDGGAVPNVKILVDGISINSASLGIRREVDPGTHAVKASAEGYRSAEIHVTVPAGGSATAPLSLEKQTSAAASAPTRAPAPAAVPPAPVGGPPAPDATPPEPAATSGGRGIWPWAAFALGGAGLAVGTVGGILAIGKHSTLSNECTATCPPSAGSDLDAYHTLSTLSTIGFVVAGVGAATGTALLLWPRSESTTTTSGLHVVPILGAGTLGATGTF